MASFVISGRLLVNPAWNSWAPTERIFMKFDYFSKLFKKIQVSLKSDKNKGYVKTSVRTSAIIYRRILRARKFATKNLEKIKTRILCSMTFFLRKSCRLWNNVWKYGRARQDTDDCINYTAHAHAHCRLDTEDYKHALRICNTYCFSTATVVTRTRLNITLYVHFFL